jgi:hypothetical protein
MHSWLAGTGSRLLQGCGSCVSGCAGQPVLRLLLQLLLGLLASSSSKVLTDSQARQLPQQQQEQVRVQAVVAAAAAAAAGMCSLCSTCCAG